MNAYSRLPLDVLKCFRKPDSVRNEVGPSSCCSLAKLGQQAANWNQPKFELIKKWHCQRQKKTVFFCLNPFCSYWLLLTETGLATFHCMAWLPLLGTGTHFVKLASVGDRLETGWIPCYCGLCCCCCCFWFWHRFWSGMCHFLVVGAALATAVSSIAIQRTFFSSADILSD